MTCDDCPRNVQQSDLIRELWVRNARLKKRVEAQQGMINSFRRQATPATAEEIAEQIFKEASGG